MIANALDVINFLIKQGGRSPVVRFAALASNANLVEYIGVAPRGSLTSASVWQIIRFTYSGTFCTTAETSLKSQVWDDRASSVYA